MKCTKLFLILAVCFGISITPIMSQTAAHEAVKKDYPNLFEMYGMETLEKQKAHYIFAIDVSTFMRTNLEIIKPTIKEFINALPDGDQVTLIRKSSTNNTDFVQNIKGVQINSEVRSSLSRILDGNDFEIQNAGSDGYTMTSKILEAIMNPMSEGLVFVFMFTDFEYWTEQNQYDKSKEDWKTLKDKFQPFLDLTNGDQSRVVFPYAIYYKDNEYRENADYRPELKNIFGSLNEPPAEETAILRSFFNSMEANALAYRMKFKIFKDLAKVKMSSELNLTDDGRITVCINDSTRESFPLFTEFDYVITDEPRCLEKSFVKDTLNRQAVGDGFDMYRLNNDYKPILPRFVNLGGTVGFSIKPVCEQYSKELNMLNGLDESLKLDYDKSFEFEEQLPHEKYFFHCLPTWVDILILALIALWLLCLLVTLLINKFGDIYRSWNIIATIDDGNSSEDYSHRFPRTAKVTVTPAVLGITNNDNWKFEIITVDGPIYRFWKPRGYYIKRGTPSMNLIRKGRKNALTSNGFRVSPLKKWGLGCDLSFKVNGNNYVVQIR